MTGKFQYIVLGALITLLTISAALMVSLQSTSAHISSSKQEQLATFTASPVTLEAPNSESTDAPIFTDRATTEETPIIEAVATFTPETTELDEITKYVTMLVNKYEKSILGKSGWLHIQSEIYVPVELRGNGEPAPGIKASDLYPDDTTINNDWYQIDEQGYYRQKIGHIQTTEGRILQRVATLDGEIINLTLQVADPDYEKIELRNVQEKVHLDYNLLYLLQTAQENKIEVHAWQENDKYIVTFTNWDEEPSKFMDTERLILGTQEKFVLNTISGAFLSSEFLLNDGNSWFVLESTTNLSLEMMENLPETAQQSLKMASEQ